MDLKAGSPWKQPLPSKKCVFYNGFRSRLALKTAISFEKVRVCGSRRYTPLRRRLQSKLPSLVVLVGVEFRGLWWLNPKRLEVGWKLALAPRVGDV